jgi:hypothetical protein
MTTPDPRQNQLLAALPEAKLQRWLRSWVTTASSVFAFLWAATPRQAAHRFKAPGAPIG